MAQSFLTPINLNKLELQNAAIQNLGTAPSSPVKGQVYFDTVGNLLNVYNGTAWIALGSGTSFATPALTLGTSNAGGAATTAIRSDASIAVFDATTPTTSAVGDAAATGSAAVTARRDHTHGREAFGTPTAEQTYGTASAAGTAATLPRSDHTHGNPTHVDADHAGIHLNALAVATGSYSMGSHAITSLLDPVNPQDAATKNYVDNVAQGLSPKGSVAVATTAALPANTYANGTSGVGATLTANSNAAFPAVDGITITVASPNIRVLVKNEATGANDGIYTLTQTGSGAAPWVLTRATDSDDAGEIPGEFVYVEQGTVNGGTQWVNTNTAAITVGTTALTFTQLSGPNTMIGTANQITVTGNTISIAGTYVGQTSITTLGTIATGTWQGTAVGIGFGGTGGTTAAGARTNLASTGTGSGHLATCVNLALGDGSTTSYVITHNLGNQFNAIQVYATATPFQQVFPDVSCTSTTTATIAFSVAPSASQYSAVLVG